MNILKYFCWEFSKKMRKTENVEKNQNILIKFLRPYKNEDSRIFRMKSKYFGQNAQKVDEKPKIWYLIKNRCNPQPGGKSDSIIIGGYTNEFPL